MPLPFSPTLGTRREFHQTVGALFAAGAASSFAENSAPSGWIDAHTHVWTPDIQSYPLAPGFTAASMQPKSFTPEELFVHTKPAGVARIVLIQMSYYATDNRYMLDMIARYKGTFSGVAIVDHHDPNVARTMVELSHQGVRGFRLHPIQNDANTWPNDEGMARVWKTARENNLAVCPLINPSDIPIVDRMCELFPKTRVVIDHFARIGVSGTIEADRLDQLVRLSRFPEVFVKTSAFYALGKKKAPYEDLGPMIKRLVDTFGPDRLMWASDNPYQVQPPHRYQDSIDLIRSRLPFLSESDKHHLLHDTAARVFFS